MFDFLKNYLRFLLEGSMIGILLATIILVNYGGWHIRQAAKSFIIAVIGLLILLFTK